MSEVPTEVAPALPDSEPEPGADPGLATTLGSTSAARTRPDREAQVRPGDELGGRYRIIERIGAGGMGTVYLAEHIAIGKRVAIKILGSEFAHKARLVDRFLREARAASLIEHEHIVDITDFGHVTEGVPYFAMEFLEGKTLAEVIEQDGRLPWPRARRIFLQICTALDAAHHKGVIHRDMKPDNVFLVKRAGEDQFVKVLDFGIAKLVTEDADQGLTQTGAVIGTAAYMSPEQAQSLEVDPRTDVYSAGIILYQMLTGRVPFTADGFMGVAAKHLTERPPSMRSIAPDAEISVGLDRVVLKALRKPRDERYGSVTEFAQALRSLGDEATGKRRPGWIWPGIAVVAAALTVMVAWPGSDPPTDSRRALADDASASAEHRRRDESPPAEIDAVRPETAPETTPETTPAAEPNPRAPEQPTNASKTAPPAPSGDPTPPSTGTVAGVIAQPTAQPTGEPTSEPTGATDTGASTTPSTSPDASRKPANVRTRLSDRDITRGLRKIRKRTNACGRTHAGLGQVRITVTFEIGPDGRVTQANAHPPYKGFPLGRCVVKEIRSIRFPVARNRTKTTRELVLK